MEERQITIEGESHRLERPFMVIATQNPIESQGTFPLPEAQLDRFLLKISMGYPTVEQEKEILLRFKETQPLETLNPVASVEAIVTAQNEYTKTKVTDAVLDYIVNLAKASREHKDLSLGISPRGTQAILRAVQIYAILQGRDYVLPDDVKKMAEHVWCHRFVLKGGSRLKEGATKKIMDELLDQIPVPAETDLMS